jgi:hypothetical protein
MSIEKQLSPDDVIPNGEPLVLGRCVITLPNGTRVTFRGPFDTDQKAVACIKVATACVTEYATKKSLPRMLQSQRQDARIESMLSREAERVIQDRLAANGEEMELMERLTSPDA